MDVVAVDWSGAAHGAATHIWLAHVRDGELMTLRNGRHRSEVVDDLIALRHRSPAGLSVGLDFAFSFPAWFARQQACTTIDDVWALAERQGEQWLADCAPPFWGRKGHRRPDLPEHFRQAEHSASVGGISAKSVFQILGAGSVGTGSVRGMPHLRRLHQAGFCIWPFHQPSPWTVLEIYPRLLTGPVHKRNRQDRSRYILDSPWRLPPSSAALMVDSEDAFDAAISALVMDRHATELAHLEPTSDPVALLEGDVWRPAPHIDSPLNLHP
jgi:hypothetical protein